MGLSTLSTNEDTRLIKHGNTVFKLKLTFTNPTEQVTQTSVDLHSEIEEVVGAVMFMVQSGTPLVKIQTEHFLICPILTIWKMGKRLGFRQLGEELDVFPKVIHLTFNLREVEERSVGMWSGVQCGKDQSQTTDVFHQQSEPLQRDSVEKQTIQTPRNQTHKIRNVSPKITVQSDRSKYSLRSASHQTAKSIKGPDSQNTNANNSSTLVPMRISPRKTVRTSVMTSESDRVCASSSATEIAQLQSKESSKHSRSSSVLGERTQQKLTSLTSKALSSNCGGKKENHSSQRPSSQSQPLNYEKTLAEKSSHWHPTQRTRRVYNLRQNLSRSTISEEQRLRTLASSVDSSNESLERSSPLDRKRTVPGFQQKDRHLVELSDIQEEAKLQMLASNCSAANDKGKRVKRKRGLVEMFTDSVITPIKRALRPANV